jgi:DNA-binding CsgD family transcriptional regulator
MAVANHTPIVCPVLVGREHELAVLEHQLSGALAARGHTVLLTGDAGVGKSRLAAEIRVRAASRGMAVLQGRCFEPDRSLPYAPLIDLLRACLGARAPAAVPEALGPLAPHLVGLMPEYISLLPHAVAAPALDPRHERHRIIQAFVQFIAYQVRISPLLLLVEDLHWSDDASLDVLLALARFAPGERLLVLLTYRADEVQPALVALQSILVHNRLVSELRLAPLDYQQADTMLRSIFQQQHPIRGDFLAVLHGLTEGNPFFIEEVLKALVAAGDIFHAEGRWDRKPLAELKIPRTLHAAVEQRVATLTPTTRHVLVLAAVAGRRFDFELLWRLTGADERTLVGQMKELIAAQLVVEESADRFAFRHALTRATLYAGLLARERRTLHATIASQLEALVRARGDEALDAAAADLAYHSFEAGDWERAGGFARQAAERAKRLYAPQAAIEHLTRAIEADGHRGLPPSGDLLRARGALHDTIGVADAALTDYHAALDAARATVDRRQEWWTLLEIGFFYSARDDTRMGEYLRQALELARDLGDPALLGQSLNRYGNWHLFVELPREALGYHLEALAIFETIANRPGLAATYDLLGVTHIMSVDKLAAVRYYERAVALFRELGDLQGLSSALATVALRGASYFHASTLIAEDGHDACIRDAEEALEIARRIGWRAGEAGALVYSALIHGPHGRYAPALRSGRAALVIAEEIEHSVWTGGAHMALGATAFDLLDYTTAQVHLERAGTLAKEIGVFFRRRVAGYLALTAIAQRDLAGAAALLTPLLTDTTPMETQGQRLDWVAGATLALANNNPQHALNIADRLIASVAHAEEHEPGCVPMLWLLRGEALLALGRAPEAAADLRAAADGAQRLGLLPNRWRILLTLGRLYQAQSRRKLAEACFAEARTIVADLARELSDDTTRARFLAAAGALLPRPSTQSPRRSEKAQAGGLTAREREIAGLIAEGKINREIAEVLVLGERTVETHISNILAKLGFSSRRQVATWVLAKELVKPSE